MEWQEWSRRLTEALGLKKAPVAITYTDEAPAGAGSDRCRACTALLKAAQEEVIDLTAVNSTCPGGSQYLGLRPQDPAHARALREFLTRGEKLLSCPVAIHRMMALTPAKPPFGAADHVIFAPLGRAALRPDVTVFVVNGWQAARLVNLAVFETGTPMECDPSGSLCRAVITYPLITGKVNISFGDVTARRSERMAEDELFVSLPYAHLRSVAESLDRCSAGTAKSELPPAMRRAMEEAGGGGAGDVGGGSRHARLTGTAGGDAPLRPAGRTSGRMAALQNRGGLARQRTNGRGSHRGEQGRQNARGRRHAPALRIGGMVWRGPRPAGRGIHEQAVDGEVRVSESAGETHVCETCGATTTGVGHLCRGFNPVKPYVCEYCGVETDDPRHMCYPQVEHLKYQCVHCGRLAARSGALCHPKQIAGAR